MRTERDATDRKGGDRYELLGELASGGMATVYLARMRRPMGFSRLVAVKCMHPQFAKDPAFATMFVDEARLTARLRHPNIVPTLDIVEGDGQLLLVMEYVEGASVAGLIKASAAANARIPVAIAAAVVHDLLLGLHAAHEATDDDDTPLAIIHRDVSPQNVIVGVDGMARVLDFGVARARHHVHHSAETEIKGKIPYMPPEQLCGEALDRRVDVYAAGVILWEMLVGKRLFEGPSETVIARRVLDDVVVPPSARIDGIAPELDRVVMKALAREANDRFATALEMAEELARVVPPASRTEVASWVRSRAPVVVKPMSSGALPSLPSLPSPPPSSAEVTTIVAVLERAETKRSATHADAATPEPPPRRARFVGGLVGAACMLAAALVGKAALTEKPAAAATSPAAHVVAAPLATASSSASAPAAAPAAVVEAAPVAATATTKPRPVAKKSPPPAVEAPPATDARAASCRPPYTVDADGHRHYKVECI